VECKQLYQSQYGKPPAAGVDTGKNYFHEKNGLKILPKTKIVNLFSTRFEPPKFNSQGKPHEARRSHDMHAASISPQRPRETDWHELSVAKVLKFDRGKLRAGQVTIDANRG
jgi:hypothetical protein